MAKLYPFQQQLLNSFKHGEVMKEQEFFSKFDMQVQASHRKLRRITDTYRLRSAWNYSVSDSVADQYQTMPIEEVECVEVLMPADRLQDIIAYITDCEDSVRQQHTDRQLMYRYEQDRYVRLNNPAVEKAYQKYVMLLELARK